MFRVGQEITPIDRRGFADLKPNEAQPKFGRIYTVRRVIDCGAISGVQLNEIQNPVNYPNSPTSVECAFDARGFRPVVRRQTDISIFTRMLNPTQVNA